MIFSENRYPPRIKCGAGFFGIMLRQAADERMDRELAWNSSNNRTETMTEAATPAAFEWKKAYSNASESAWFPGVRTATRAARAGRVVKRRKRDGNPIPAADIAAAGATRRRAQREEQLMADMKAQTITLRKGDELALEYLGAAVVLQWANLPEDARKAILQQADAVGGLPLVADLHEQIRALIMRLRG